jgi:hypothetical protein
VVNVPATHFGLLMDRLAPMMDAQRMSRDRSMFVRFLRDRTSDAFLAQAVERWPAILEWLASPYPYLDACPEIDLAGRLKEADLLPDVVRATCVRVMSDLAVDIPDSGVLALRARELFTEDEFAAVRDRIQEELFPILDDVIDNWRSGFDSNKGDPYGYFEPLRGAIDEFATEFPSDKTIERARDDALQLIDETVEELQVPDWGYDDDRGWRAAPDHSSQAERSVFDDLDQ